MFVATGARERRREDFARLSLVPLLDEARRLGLDTGQVKKLIDVCGQAESRRYPDPFRVRHVLRAAALQSHWDAGHADALVEEFAVPRDRLLTVAGVTDPPPAG